MNRPPVRWPLHPPPDPLESLSSWLRRLAGLYRMSVRQLVEALDPDHPTPNPEWDLWEIPDWLTVALFERTGVSRDQLKMTTLGGWRPWLIETIGSHRDFDMPEVFHTYARGESVLLRPGEAGRSRAQEWSGWHGPWMPTRKFWRRCCLVCAADPGRPKALVWMMPLVTGCAEHGCRLDEERDKWKATLPEHERPQPVPVPEPLAMLDRYTYEGLRTGMVTLPGRQVQACVWFRLLRALVDEVSLAPTTKRQRARALLESVWEATGRPIRNGLPAWRPYELMDPPMQEAMLHAAGTAMQLVADRQIIAEGSLASALVTPPHQPVYEGDNPARPLVSAWTTAITEANAAFERARVDPGTAQQLLALLTLSTRTLEHFRRERDFLIDNGIPADFLPTPADYAGRLCPACDEDLYAVVQRMTSRLDEFPPWIRDWALKG